MKTFDIGRLRFEWWSSYFAFSWGFERDVSPGYVWALELGPLCICWLERST